MILNRYGFRHQFPNRPKGRFLPNPRLKLLEQCREVMRFKQFSRRTEETYLQWIRRFILFHRKKELIRSAAVTDAPLQTRWIWRHPQDMGEVEVRAFLTDLAVRRGVVAATQNQALNALLFLYREVIGWRNGVGGRVREGQTVAAGANGAEPGGGAGLVGATERHPAFNRAGFVWDGFAVDGVFEIASQGCGLCARSNHGSCRQR